MQFTGIQLDITSTEGGLQSGAKRQRMQCLLEKERIKHSESPGSQAAALMLPRDVRLDKAEYE